MDTAPDSTFRTSDSPDAYLGRYLSRPLLYKTVMWSLGSPIIGGSTPTLLAQYENYMRFSFEPWKVFFENQHIVQKIMYYKMIRCVLKVKFVVNTNPFQYGTAIAAYTPLSGDDMFVVGMGTIYPDPVVAIPLSQRPHIYISADSSTGGVITCPFVYHANYIDMTADADAMQDMGRIDVMSINPLCTLGRAGSPADPIANHASVSIFIWAEDVELACPTMHVPVLVPPPDSQAGDEYGDGPVSKVANAVAMGAGDLATAPLIGPYARATSMIAAGIASIASAFGYSRPAVLDDVKPFKPTFWSNMANTDAGDSTFKLTVGSKQEVTIDPRVVGLNNMDEMTIKSIAEREAYFHSFVWDVLKPDAGRIAAWNVTPMLFSVMTHHLAATNSSRMANSRHPCFVTPTAFAALPFRYWRGTMRFRIQVVAPALARGRFRIVWDPVSLKDTQGTGAGFSLAEYQNCYNTVVDIAETRDITVDIGWGQQYAYAEVEGHPGSTEHKLLPWYSDDDTVSDEHVREHMKGCNGAIGLYVVNPIVSLDQTTNSSPIYVNVFACCPDLEIAAPRTTLLDNYYYRPAQEWRKPLPPDIPEEPPDPPPAGGTGGSNGDSSPPANSQSGEGPGAMMPPALGPNFVDGESGDITWLGPQPLSKPELLNEVFFGDPIVSFRTMLKRYYHHACLYPKYPHQDTHKTKGAIVANTWELSNFPSYKGIVAPAKNATRGHRNSRVLEFTEDDVPGSTNHVMHRHDWINAKMTMLNYVSAAYVARRGGVRWKYAAPYEVYSYKDTKNNLPLPMLDVERGSTAHHDGTFVETLWEQTNAVVQETNDETGVVTDVVDIQFVNNASWSRLLNKTLATGAGGMAQTALVNNPVVEVDLPYYNQRRFIMSRDMSLSGGHHERHRVHYVRYKRSVAQQYGYITSHCAAADDFSLHFFVGCPPLYYCKEPLVFTPQDLNGSVVPSGSSKKLPEWDTYYMDPESVME